MRTLYLLRHAKSSWKDASLRDFDRPLKERGREAAAVVGQRLAAEKLSQPLALCSPAVRTRETAEIVLKSAKLKVDERFDERIYEASLRDLLEVISEIPENVKAAILIGHNPGCEEVLAYLTSESRHVPTCGLAKIKLEQWKNVRAGEGSLDWFITAKELAED